MPKKNKKKGDGGKKESNSSQNNFREFTDEELAGSRPPAWAKGKSIGMWHRVKNMKKKKKPKNKRKVPCIPLDIPNSKVEEVAKILRRIGVSAPPRIQSRNFKSIKERYAHVADSAFKSKFLASIQGNILDRMSHDTRCSLRKDSSLDEKYEREERMKMSRPDVRNMMEFRQKLPAWKKKQEILNAVERNKVILITGETGCGKTTQVSQFILEEAILSGNGSQTNIVCTQPRRISAIAMAERVAAERGERLGESVGYQIRLEKVEPRNTAAIVFCTTGVLLQRMHGDPLLTRISTIVLDEIHERNTESDFIIALLRDILPLRPDLKIILMSATLNAERFSAYFENCPTVHIPGFTYPVTEYYLEDVLEMVDFSFPVSKNNSSRKDDKSQDDKFLDAFYRDLESKQKYSKRTIANLKNPESNEMNTKLILALLEHICVRMPPGAILVFLPGWDKISAMNRLLTQSQRFPSYRYRIIPLHSLMPTVNQKEVFSRPPKGVRKIVLSTNIAETSLTIDDIVYVIDCGKLKIKDFDVDGNVSTLKEEWVSLANATQRKGRAGRVQEGVCFHLYSKGREMMLQKEMLPEMLRTRLEEAILQGKILQVGKIKNFLRKVMDPPTERAIDLSIETLTAMNALDEEENLTPLGFHLANLPMDPQVGKMLIYGSLVGILDPLTSIAAAMTFKDPFIIPLKMEKEVDQIRCTYDADHKSDHLIHAKVVAQFREAKRSGHSREYLRDNFLSSTVLEQIDRMKKQLVSQLHSMKFASNSSVLSPENNFNSENIALVRSIICAGLFPNVAIVHKCKFTRAGRLMTKVLTLDGTQVHFHPKSIFAKNAVFQSRLLVYFEKLKGTNINLFDSTMVYPSSLIFFCYDLSVTEEANYKILRVGKHLKFRCSHQLGSLVMDLRAWLDWLIEYRMCHPGVVEGSTKEALVMEAVFLLITLEEKFSSSMEDKSDDSEFSDSDFSISDV